MLLSNISKTPTAASRVAKLKIPVYFSPRIYTPLSRSATSSSPDELPDGPPQEVDVLPLLVDAFVAGASTKNPSSAESDSQPVQNQREGSLHFLASVFANVTNVFIFSSTPLTSNKTQIPEGRIFFLTPIGDPLEYPLSKIACFTEHPDTIRRGGAASTIKYAQR